MGVIIKGRYADCKRIAALAQSLKGGAAFGRRNACPDGPLAVRRPCRAANAAPPLRLWANAASRDKGRPVFILRLFNIGQRFFH